MARLNSARLTSKEKSVLRQELIRAVQIVRKRDVWHFLEGLLTSAEVLMLGRRIRIAKALLAGKRYEDIAFHEKASYSTIQAVDNALQRGLEGYRRTLRHSGLETLHKTTMLPNETVALLKSSVPGAHHFGFWLDILGGNSEEK